MDALTIGSQRLVHLDLKGAPPKLIFLEKFFPFIKHIGATGVLIEWEDTFPYQRELIQLGGLSNSTMACGAPYSIEEARKILELAADSDLTIIPLVQTFGHLEFVLKHEEWKGLREVENYPSSICPSNSGTMPLIRNLVKQIIAFHPNIQYIHIGADEVWHLGLCATCTKRIQNSKHGKASLYLEHVTEVASYIKENFPHLNVIIWDDMLRSIDIRILEEYFLSNLVEPMVWHYNNIETFGIGGELWEKYSNIFRNLWVASAFKGATSSCQMMPIPKYHISNHEAWLSELGTHGGKILNFRGIAFTGWSRYDHYATLCELLPCSIPSLWLCMKTWLTGGFNIEIHNSVSKSLGFVENNINIDIPIRPSTIPSNLTFPGSQILVGIEWLCNVRAKYKSTTDSDTLNTWFNQWQVLNNYTNPMQIETFQPVIDHLNSEVHTLETYLKSNLDQYFYPHTIDELLGTWVAPMKQHLRHLKCECETQLFLGCRVRGHKRLNI